jgi:hypothetical protein
MILTPTDRLHANFGWRDFPTGASNPGKHGLRFELGDPLPMGPLRFLRAIDRARTIASGTFARSATLCAIVTVYGGERRTRRHSVALQHLREIGFAYDFGPAERVKQADREHCAEFGEDLCRYWYAADFPNEDDAVSALLWASISSEMDIQPHARWIDTIHVVDFDRKILLNAYDDRGMDVIAADPARLAPLYEERGDWLLDHDRAAMDAVFAPLGGTAPKDR